MVSQLEVKKSTRRYNNPDRIMPGAVFLFNKERHVMSGQRTNGSYYLAADDPKDKKTNCPAVKCRIATKNTGLVYL